MSTTLIWAFVCHRGFRGSHDKLPDREKERNDDLCDRVSGIRTDLYSPSEQLCSIGIPSGSQEYCKKEPDQPFQTGFICYFCNDTWRRDHIDRHSDERVCKHRIRGSGSPAVRHA